MSAYAELSAAIREPMREWWKSTGSWLLLTLAFSWACNVWLSQYIDYGFSHSGYFTYGVFNLIKLISWLLFILATTVLPPLIWLLASGVAVDTADPRLPMSRMGSNGL